MKIVKKEKTETISSCKRNGELLLFDICGGGCVSSGCKIQGELLFGDICGGGC